MKIRVQTVLYVCSSDRKTSRSNSVKQLSRVPTVSKLKPQKFNQTIQAETEYDRSINGTPSMAAYIKQVVAEEHSICVIAFVAQEPDKQGFREVVNLFGKTVAKSETKWRTAITTLDQPSSTAVFSNWQTQWDSSLTKQIGQQQIMLLQLGGNRTIVLARFDQCGVQQELPQYLKGLAFTNKEKADVWLKLVHFKSSVANSTDFRTTIQKLKACLKGIDRQKPKRDDTDKENFRNRGNLNSERQFVIKPNSLGKMTVEYDYYHKDKPRQTHRNYAHDDDLQNMSDLSRLISDLQAENSRLKMNITQQREEFARQTERYIHKKNQKIQRLNDQLTKLKSQLAEELSKNETLAKKYNDTITQMELVKIDAADSKQDLKRENQKLQQAIGISEQELAQISARLESMDRSHSAQLQQLQQKLQQYRYQLQSAERELESSQASQRRYLQQISRLEYKFHKERSKYIAERDKADRLAKEIQIMDRKLNQIINIKQQQIDSFPDD